MFSTFTQGWAGMTVLDSKTKDRMSAPQIRKVFKTLSYSMLQQSPVHAG